MRRIIALNLALITLSFAASFVNAQQPERLVVIDTSKRINEKKGKDIFKPIQNVQTSVNRMSRISTLSSSSSFNNLQINNNNGYSVVGRFTQSTASILAYDNNVLISYLDMGSSVPVASKFTGFAYSTDGGATFTDGGVLPTNPSGDGGLSVLARNNTTGRIYLLTTSSFTAVSLVFRSDDNGVTWSTPVAGTPGSIDDSRPWMTVDNFAGTGNGNVYVVSKRFNGITPLGTYFFRSTDNGSTFGPIGGVQITPTAHNGSFVTVAPDHSIYVFWAEATVIKMRKSIDQGATFGAAVTVATGLLGNASLGLTGIRQGTASSATFSANTFPQAAINPVSGHIYLTYANAGTSPDKADVFFIISTDGGATWSTPSRVNDDLTTTDQWAPSIAVTPDGLNLGIFYYSRQEDPVNNNLFRYYSRVATISGSTVTFTPGASISLVSSLPEFGREFNLNNQFMVDYTQATATADGFLVTWTDNRDDFTLGLPRKDPNIYFAKFPVTGPPPTPYLTSGSHTITSGDGIINVNECNQIDLSVLNVGTGPATGISAILSSTTPGISVSQNSSAYPAIAKDASISNTTPFTICTGEGFVCGKPIELTLTLEYSGGSSVLNFTLPTGTPLTPVAFHNNTSTLIADEATTDIPITVSGINQNIGKVTLSLYMTHSFLSDVDVSLIAPDGTVVELATNLGAIDGSYGVSCSNRVVFEDDASASIVSSSSPFFGTFRPEGLLSSFAGKSGSSVNGIWKLRFVDEAGADEGNFICATLTVIPVSCEQPLNVTINQASTQADPTSNLTINFTAVFSRPVTGFTESDVLLSGTASPAGLVITEIAPNNGTTYNVAVSGMIFSGTVIAMIPAGAAMDDKFQPNEASTSTDNTVTYELVCDGVCPENITKPATSLSGAVVDYGPISPPTQVCNSTIGIPSSGSLFPIGTTTVNVYKNASQLVYALKANTLVTFNISDPSVVSLPLVITGLQSGESLKSIDFRVSDGKLFAVGITSATGGFAGRIYTINTTTGAATQVGSGTFPLPSGSLFGPAVSIDIDPTTDMIRLVTDEDLNMRISASNGTYTVDGVIDPVNRSVSGIAYSNNIPSATSTTLYDIGFGTQVPIAASTLYIQDPNKGTLEQVGVTNAGIFSHTIGFDISQTGDPLVSATRATGTFPNVQQVPTLFRVNLQTGIATNIGTIGTTVEDITIAPVTFTEPSCSFTVTVTPPPPSVTINQASGQSDPTNTSPINFTVVFSEAITGFTSSDVTLSGTAGATTTEITEIAPNNGTTYNIAVSGMTSNGTVIASIPANVVLSIGNIGNIASTSSDNSVVYNMPPTITCPGDITVNSPQGGCSALVSFTGENDIQYTGTGSYILRFSANNNGQTLASGINLPSSYTFPSGVNNVSVSIIDDYGSATCNFKVIVLDTQPPVLNCTNRTADALPGVCYARVPIIISGTENCARFGYPVSVTTSIGVSFTSTNTNFSPNNIVEATFGVGVSTILVTATDAAGNTATCSYTITVVDKQDPVITSKPDDVTVECVSQIPVASIASVTASDNCGTPTITHVGDVISNQSCANKYTVTRTYQATDGSGNTATTSQLITVDDKTPPTITGLTPSKRILAPPNHKMVDITLAYTVNDNCVSTPNVTVSITSNEPVNGTGDGDTDPDWEIIDNTHIRLRAERSAQGTGRIYTITVTVNDGCNAPVSATTEVRVTHNITGPHSGNSFKVGSTVAFTGEFWDVPGNKHTAKWLIDGISVNGVVTEPAGTKNGKVTGSYKFTAPGVYKLQMNVTDQKGVTTYANTNGDLEAIVVIYDPNGGFTYGGGYYDSPVGALVANSSSAGKASYGFTMNYFKNATNPKGETQFEFKVGEFEFNALNFEYLVISNSMAQFKGTGKIIGGQSGVAFTMTVTDGQLDGTGIDKIRMKIYNKNNGKIIYDNQPGASDAALPIQAVGFNSIVVISGTNSSLTKSNTSSARQAEMEVSAKKILNGLDVIVYPNPSPDNFSISVRTNDTKEKIMMQVVDMYGRVIEKRDVRASSIIKFGERYNTGTYFVRIIQGREHREIKLVKISN